MVGYIQGSFVPTDMRIFSNVCLRKECKERCPLLPKQTHYPKFQFMVRVLTLILLGMFLGSMLTIRLHGQGQPLSRMNNGYIPITQNQEQLVILSTKVTFIDSTVQDLSKKMDQLKTEADATQYMGAGIGIAITFLQLLGFLAKNKERATI